MLPEIFNTGLNSNVWGSGAWVFLHSITLTYPNNPTENDKKIYKSFFETLGYLLPCNQCSNHYNEYLASNPININVLENKETLTRWLYNLHNNVNHILHKKKIDFDVFVNNYYDMYSNVYENNDKYENLLYIGSIVIIISAIIGILLYRHKC